MISFFLESWSVFCALAPWLFLGGIGAGILHVFLPKGFVLKHLGKDTGFKGILKSTLIGVPLPLCSCGVIPAAIGLRRDGASKGSSVSFLISTPQTGLDSIFVSAGMIGWPFAIFKLIVAFLAGLFGGVLTDLFISSDEKLFSDKKVIEEVSQKNKLKRIYIYFVEEILGSIWKWIAFGVFLSAIINTAIPEKVFFENPLLEGLSGMLLVLVFSIPLYVCATASVPIAAALISQGMAPGVALVFLMAGPATNVATIGAVAKTLGIRSLFVYMFVIISASILGAYIFDYLLFSTAASSIIHHHDHVGIVEQVCGILLLCLFLELFRKDIQIYIKLKFSPKREISDLSNITIEAENINCQNCVKKVAALLASKKDIYSYSIDLVSRRIELQIAQDSSYELLLKYMKDAGYPSKIVSP